VTGELVGVWVTVHPDKVDDLYRHAANYLQTPTPPRAKLSRFTEEQIAEIQRLYWTRSKKQVELASMYKCGQGTISTMVSTGQSTSRTKRSKI
jgi:hypothetical protein